MKYKRTFVLVCIRGDPRAPLGGVSSDLLDWSARVSERGEIYYRLYYRGDILLVARAKRAVFVSLMRQYLYFVLGKQANLSIFALIGEERVKCTRRGKKKVVFPTLSLQLRFFLLFPTLSLLLLYHTYTFLIEDEEPVQEATFS
jgi:hypothetical protein